jgi:transcriptional regulator GlxA family with amidase domain
MGSLACRALTETRTPLKRIAIETGFGDEQTLRRSLLRRFGIGLPNIAPASSPQKSHAMRIDAPIAG